MMDHSLGYLPALPLDVRFVSRRPTDGIIVSDLVFLAGEDQQRTAYLVKPEGDGPFPIILYVHWYEPEACDANRTQFLDEASELAQHGVMSLLIETMWSDREWFLKRTQAGDFDASVRQTIELRRAMDLLLSQPGAESSQFAYVGHDFGAMYGIVAGSVDARPTAYVLMAGTTRFPDWFLYYPQMEGDDRKEFIKQMRALDPIEHIGKLSPTPILMQFGNSDPHVPIERAQALSDAAGESAKTLIYNAGHALNEAAKQDRMEWLMALLSV